MFLFPENCYCGIRTNESTVDTSRAVVLDEDGISISLEIDLLRQS
jgi:hypothetical protein